MISYPIDQNSRRIATTENRPQGRTSPAANKTHATSSKKKYSPVCMRHSTFKNEKRKTINSHKSWKYLGTPPTARAQREAYKIIKQVEFGASKTANRGLPEIGFTSWQSCPGPQRPPIPTITAMTPTDHTNRPRTIPGIQHPKPISHHPTMATHKKGSPGSTRHPRPHSTFPTGQKGRNFKSAAFK